MPRQLIFLSVVVLFLCVIGASLVNFRTAGPTKSQRELSLLAGETSDPIDWIIVLSQLPQYKKAEMKTASIPTTAAEVHISDSRIIGIVVDKPASVLIYLNQSQEIEPLQLTVGEGWLKDWKIQKIAPNAITWVNVLSQQPYIQTLFASAEDESKDSPPKTGTQ
jgi:hypothetical protein